MSAFSPLALSVDIDGAIVAINGRPGINLAFGGRTVRIEFRGDRARQLVEFLFADVLRQSDLWKDAAAAHVTLVVDEDSNGLSYVNQFGLSLRSNRRDAAQTDDGVVAGHLLGDVIYHLANKCDSGLVFHAGAVVCDDNVILLPGKSGAGKTSTTAFLTCHGFRYLTDELIYIALHDQASGANIDRTVHGFVRPFNFKTAVLPVVEDQFGIDISEFARYASEDACLIPHRRLSISGLGSPTIARTVLFPCYDANSTGELTALSHAQTALGLMGCLINGRNLAEHGFRAVSELARQLSGFRIYYSHFEQIAEIFEAAAKDSGSGFSDAHCFTRG